jgi:hypothetical protein
VNHNAYILSSVAAKHAACIITLQPEAGEANERNNEREAAAL